MLSYLYQPRRVRPREGYHGGWTQRLDAASSSDEGAEVQPFMSRLAGGMLLQWAEGGLAASGLQARMADEVADMRRMNQRPHCMVERLASIRPGNHSLQGLRALLEHTGLYGLLTPVPGATPPHEADAVLLPSSLIRLLWEADRRHCRSALGMDVVKLRSFWDSFLARPKTARWAAAHPELRGKTAAELVTTVPCVTHGDAAPVTKRQGAMCVQWSALMGTGPERLTKFLAFSFLKQVGYTETRAWEMIIRDFS